MSGTRIQATTREAATAATRARILDAAFELFRTQWYEDVTMRCIAAEAGVALQTVVNHFGTKEGVFAGVIDKFQHVVEDVRDAPPDDDAERHRQQEPAQQQPHHGDLLVAVLRPSPVGVKRP